MLAQLGDHNPYLELEPDLPRMKRWHWINQSAYWAARIHLPGHLLSLKGDRPAMHSSVEGRYPFLDERLFRVVASLHPRWKMRGFRDKYVLRKVRGALFTARDRLAPQSHVPRAAQHVLRDRKNGAHPASSNSSYRRMPCSDPLVRRSTGPALAEENSPPDR